MTPAPATTTSSPKRDPRVRLWKTGGLVAVFVLTMFVGNFCISADRSVTRGMLGLDFLAFYFGGNCVYTGQYEKLYDLGAAKTFEFATGHQANMEMGKSFGPWWNPPFAAWIFEPLAALPYRTALLIWWAFGLACLGASIYLMSRMLKGDWKTKLLVPLFILTAMPFFQAFTHGQNTFLSLFLLTVVVVLWRNGYSFAAGLVCGLLFYKPQLGAVVALVLCLSQGRRALLGVTLVGFALLVVNVLTLPGTLHAFIYSMPANLHWMQEENHYFWERHVTFKGFWRMLIQGHASGPTSPTVLLLWGICQTALVGGLLAMIYNALRQSPSASRVDRVIAATIVSMPLLMPFYFDYDLLLVSVAAAVYVADRQRDDSTSLTTNWEDRWLPRLWLTLYLTSEVATIVAGHTRFHPTVPVLTAIAALLIRRALRPEISVSTGAQPMPSAGSLPLAA